MKTTDDKKFSLSAIAAAVILQCQPALAEYEELPTLVVEGGTMEPGTTALQPGTVGTLDAADLLKRVPGGNVNRNGPLTGIAQFRGLYGDRVAVNVDGMALKNAGPNAMDSRMSAIPSALIRSIKVYRGVTPVSVGLETMGGAVVAESRRAEFTDSETWKPQLFGTFGWSQVNNGLYGGGMAGVANQNYRFHFSASHEDGDNYRYKDNRNLKYTSYDRQTYQAGFGFRRDGHEFGAAYNHKFTGSAGTPSLPMDIRWIRTDTVNADYAWQLSDTVKLKTAMFFQDADHEMTNYHMRNAPTDPARWRQNNTDVVAAGYKAALVWSDIAGGELEVGVDGDLATHNSKVTNPNNAAFFVRLYNDVNRNRYGAYAEWRGEPLERLTVNAGVRYRYTYMDAGKVDGTPARMGMMNPMMRAGTILRDRFNAADRRQDQHDVDIALDFNYRLNDNLNLALGLARKTHAPIYQQRYTWLPLESTGGLADGRVYVGNIGLDSEKSYEAVAGFDLNLPTLGVLQNVYFEPRAFYRYVNDYIQGQAVNPADLGLTPMQWNMFVNMMLPNGCPNNPGGNTTDCTLRWANVDAQLYGVDMQGGFAIGDHWRVDGLMTYTRGEKLSGKDDNLYRIAPLNGRVRLTYSIWDFAFSGEYAGALRQDKVARYNNERKTSDWSVVNLRLQYQPSYQYVQGLKLAFGVDNVFDTKYADHVNGINRVRESRIGVGNRVFNPGRNYYVTLNYTF
ncbi:iron complex outermembrane recepter protein [Methylomarinovum caldicuralii]|uniref:Iron complex outermembrane recepter protein n=1 Tax=Methylomarinovum caldicuralii TaxID=438856 RepID=A0AAU9C0A5_9GAMM|nr:TonB-dependent receptor [Methylomarinovum caldicuralii]BCX81737.1 iron complex outermembrane recepter protein [Methylomarinovum caldicuralii]